MTIWEKPISHGELLKKAWREIEAGAKERKHPFHLSVFATTSKDGPSLRTVTLRRFWRSPAQIAFHAHTGSPKVLQCEESPEVTWLFYDPAAKFQIRARGIAKVHRDDELADEHWEKTKLFSRRCYVGEAPTQQRKKPDHGMPKELMTREPTLQESEEGREKFCVITTRINFLDVVELDVQGHRRAFFRWGDDGQLETGWLTP